MRPLLFVAALALAATCSRVCAAEAQGPANSAASPVWFERALDLDLGAESAPDAVQAFAAMHRAAEGGDPQAAFNVAVMLDSGRGAARDSREAAVWYARAAARGMRRGAYNLGLMYEAGEGVPANADLSRAWYGASNLRAARERAAELKPGVARPKRVATPTLLFPIGSSALAGDDQQVDLVWTSSLQPEAVRFFVELRGLEPGASKEIWAGFVDLSSVRLPLPSGFRMFGWRVSAVARGSASYAVSSWSTFMPPRAAEYVATTKPASSGLPDKPPERPSASETAALQSQGKNLSPEVEHPLAAASNKPALAREGAAPAHPDDDKGATAGAPASRLTDGSRDTPPALSDSTVLIILAQPNVAKLSDLDDKAVVIAGLSSISPELVSAALSAGGAHGVRLTSGTKGDIDRLVSGEISAAVVARVTPAKAQSFPQIPGFSLLRVAIDVGRDKPGEIGLQQ